ncbi:MAG TPA: hypothetical protein VIN05_12395 [Roseovarius sp.]
MRRALILVPLVGAAFAVWALAYGGDAAVARWAADWQRDFQNGLATALRALRAGEPGALALLMSLAFGYGFVHAVGPGHGKVLIGGYGMGRRVPVLRLSLIALGASLAQAATAVLLVYGGALVLGYTRSQLTGAVEGWMAPLSSAAIGAIGLWLIFRGARRLWRQAKGRRAHTHDAECDCGHKHGPTPQEAAQTHGAWDTAALIGGIAIRPCTGALLLLVLTWQMNIALAGLAATLAMALGTASVTICVAVLSVLTREGTLRAVQGAAPMLRLMPLAEIMAGAAIAVIALQMLRWL